MAYRANQNQQMRIDDSVLNLTKREQRMLRGSWATAFAEHVFPKINEDRFAVLYSQDAATRPNTPVNVIIGAMLLKQAYGLTDEEVVEEIAFDLRWQEALHTTSFEEQPFSDRTLSRFRERLLSYEEKTGIDLFKEEMESLAGIYAKSMNINGRLKRMDSMTISSACRRMGRLTLVYECVRQMAEALHRMGMDELLAGGLMKYVEEAPKTDPGYRLDDEEAARDLVERIKDGYRLWFGCGDALETLRELPEYRHLERMLGDQTEVELGEDVRIRLKENREIATDSLQNPSDEDATYRVKGGKGSVGYVGNLVEAKGENGSIIESYDLKPNITPDTEFTKVELARIGTPEEKTTLVTDGAYGSGELMEQAQLQNIDFVTTALNGGQTNPLIGKFELDETGRILKCPGGAEPYQSKYNPKTGVSTARFAREDCARCPHRDHCPKSGSRKHEEVRFTTKQRLRANAQDRLRTDEMRLLKNIRNGVEAVPSLLRRRYGVDAIPVRGLLRTALWFGASVGALNAVRFMNWVRKVGRALSSASNAFKKGLAICRLHRVSTCAIRFVRLKTDSSQTLAA